MSIKKPIPQNEIVYCNICNRPVLRHDIDLETGIVYCYGCHHYFPFESKSKRSREEIVTPRGTDFIRLRILRDELEIKIKWNRNFKFWKALINDSEGFPRFFILLAALFNRTRIEVRSGYIKIDHGPIDLLPMVFYSANIIRQIHVEPVGWNSGQNSSFGLYAELTSGKEELLIWNLKRSTLLFIEQEIERVLKIIDKK